MIKDIVKDQFLLSQKAAPALMSDISVAKDLEDTLKAHMDHCVGMAANMIGVNKCIIAFIDQGKLVVMMNPQIMKTSGRYYECEEGCLCHEGVKKTKRYEKIKVQYEDFKMQKKIKTYAGFTAQIIQHELDHLEGILI